MYLGSLVEVSTSEEVYEHPLHPYTKALMSAVPILDPVRGKSEKPDLLKGEIPSPLDMPAAAASPRAARLRRSAAARSSPRSSRRPPATRSHAFTCRVTRRRPRPPARAGALPYTRITRLPEERMAMTLPDFAAIDRVQELLRAMPRVSLGFYPTPLHHLDTLSRSWASTYTSSVTTSRGMSTFGGEQDPQARVPARRRPRPGGRHGLHLWRHPVQPRDADGRRRMQVRGCTPSSTW